MELSRVRVSIDNGVWQSPEITSLTAFDPKSVTLRELADHWRGVAVNRRGQSLSPNTLSEYARLVSNVLTPMADLPVRSITPHLVETWWGPQHKRAANQATKAYKHLKQLLAWAVKRKIIPTNPCDIEHATSYVAETQPDVPNAEQVEIMFDTAPDEFRTVLAFAAWGGLRKGEIFELRRKDIETVTRNGKKWLYVNVTRGVIWQGPQAIVRPPKSAKAVRSVALPSRANDLIKRHLAGVPVDPEALLFPRRPGLNEHWGEFQLNPVWRRVRAAAGYSGRFHSLRAFAATQFGMTGATAIELMDRFGHRDIETAMRYQRATGRELELLEKLG